MTPTDPVYIALTTMRGWMNAFIQTSRIDPERTSITFRGPDQLATCCKLQEVLDIADKALTHAEAREPVALITCTQGPTTFKPSEYNRALAVGPARMLEDLASNIDHEWRAKGGLNCTEICALIRSYRP